MTDPRAELSEKLPGFTSWGPYREDGTRSGLNCCFMRSGGKDDGSGLPLATYEELKDLLWRVPPETLLSILPQPLEMDLRSREARLQELRAENKRLRKAAALGLDCLLDYGEVNTPMSKAIKALKKALGDWRAALAAHTETDDGQA